MAITDDNDSSKNDNDQNNGQPTMMNTLIAQQ